MWQHTYYCCFSFGWKWKQAKVNDSAFTAWCNMTEEVSVAFCARDTRCHNMQGRWRQLGPLTITLRISEKLWLITGRAALNKRCGSSTQSKRETLKAVFCNVAGLGLGLGFCSQSQGGATDMDTKHTQPLKHGTKKKPTCHFSYF